MLRIWLVFGAAILASACQTTNMQMRAKTPGANVAGAGACVRAADRRSECEDQVGCFWDYDSGSCAASH